MPDSLLLRESARAAPVAPTSTNTTAIELVGRSTSIGRVHELLRRASALESAVLFVAEPGVDIESIARDLHALSRSPMAPWVPVNCGSEGHQLAATLFGATDSSQSDLESISSDSLIVQARGGTLFLADVTELPSAVQARLARVARDGEVRIDGRTVETNLRIVTGAPPSIDADVHEQRFRADLYRRLAATRIDLPSLRDRPGDVRALVDRLLHDIAVTTGSAPRSFTEAAVALLASLTWPGNLAELRGAVERVVAQARASVIQIEHVLPALQLERAVTPFVPAGSLREARMRFEREYITAVLEHHEWRMADAAQTLGIQRPNLYRKVRQLGIPVARASE